jgi:hypothetical protein
MLPSHSRPLARLVLLSFLLTFIAARLVTILVALHRLPDVYLHVRGTHIHHLNYGIFLLAGVGAYLLFRSGPIAPAAAVVYGIGLGLTFDEFGMWLHLGGDYWQRASFDAIIVLAAALALAGFAPPLRRWRPRHRSHCADEPTRPAAWHCHRDRDRLVVLSPLEGALQRGDSRGCGAT